LGNADIVGDLHGRLIVFDLDGTVVDSRRDLADSANQLIAELGGRELDEESIGRMVGEGARVLVERALRASGLEHEAQGAELAGSLARFLHIYDERLLRTTVPYPGIVDAINHARGYARVAILTNKPTRHTEAVLEGLGLRRLFEDVIGGDGPWPRKPDPTSIVELMGRALAPPGRTLLVGDSAVDHETALRAGVPCCLATYGFGYATFPSDRLRSVEWKVNEPAELPAVFDAFTGV
jgi:phosphoglycolate phosphatase